MAVNRRLYPRTVVISRPPAAIQTAGLRDEYSADLKAEEVVVVGGIPASIQAQRQGSSAAVGLPTDATDTLWYIFIPGPTLGLGSIKDNDVVTDDLGERYQVLAPYWDTLGYRLTCKHLSV